MLWLVLAAMTGLAVLAALWPLAARQPKRSLSPSDADFYRSQLEEIQRDVERGALPADEAAPARAEAGRRLIAASGEAGEPKAAEGSRAPRRVAAVAILAFVPLVAIGVYLTLGQPDIADAPLATRKADIRTPGGVELAIARIEANLGAHPDDARGWRVLAPIYMRLDRYGDAVNAYKQLLRLENDNAETLAALGEAMLAAADGVVTADARATFERALKAQPGLPMARFYLAFAAEQDGDTQKALGVYHELAGQDDGSAPWMLGLRSRLTALGEAKSQLQSPSFTPEQRATIQLMVQGLADRLAKSGGSAEEWARLIRAYAVLHDNDKAKAALADARKALASDSAALGRFDALARELGL